MRRSRKPITIASRRSDLARVQAQLVRAGLRKLHPSIEIALHLIDSEGDEQSEAAMSPPHASMAPATDAEAGAGNKGRFTRAIDLAVLRRDADLAVHSLKDVPIGPATGLTRAATTRRADVRDCLVSAAGYASIADLPAGAAVGTSSPRRAAQLLRIRPDLTIRPIRGNLPTRLAKVLDADGAPPCRAIVLALAGLRRLKLLDRPHAPIPPEDMLPSAGQGALAVHCRVDDHVSLTRCLPLNDANASTTTNAEREIVAGLGGDCYSPIAALVEPAEPDQPVRRNADAHWFRIRARVLNGDGTRCLEIDQRCRAKELRRAVKDAVATLIEQGAHDLLTEARRHSPLLQPAPFPGPAPTHDGDRQPGSAAFPMDSPSRR